MPSGAGQPNHQIEVETFVADLAKGLATVDALRPVAASRSGSYQPGIGPFAEAAAVKLVLAALASRAPERYAGYALNVSYPDLPRKKCDLCIGGPHEWDWAIEIKLLRLLGDNGKLNDNMLMHILSPYPEHRSAVTDCEKLAASSLGLRKMIVIYAFAATGWPTSLAIDAFELLAGGTVGLGPRAEAGFEGSFTRFTVRAKSLAGS